MGVAVADLRGTHAIACLTRLLVDVARPSRGVRRKRVTSGQLRRSATPCKNLQGLPGNASSIGHKRLRCGTADLDVLRSAAICLDLVEPQELVAARQWRFESSLPHHSTQSLRSFARGRPFDSPYPTLRIQARSWQATPGETNGVLPALSEACGRIEGSERSTSKGTLRAGTHLAGPSVELRLGKPPSRACAAEARRAEARRRTPSQHARQDVLVCSRCGQAGAVWRCC